MVARRERQRDLAGRREVDLVAARPEVRAERAEDLRLVVDDEDPRHRRRPEPDDHRQPAARRVLDLELAAHRLDEALRDREAESDASPLPRVAEALERAGTSARAPSAGCPGPRSTTRTSTASPDGAGDDAHGVARRASGDRVRDHVRERALEQPGSASTRGSVSATSTSTSAARAPMLASAAGITSSSADGACRLTSSAPGLEAAHVEQVADERVEPVGLLVDRGEELVRVVGRPLDVRPASRLVTDALIAASGVRRSCETAERIAVRSSFGGGQARRPPRPPPRSSSSASDDGELARERVEDAVVASRLDGPPAIDEDVDRRRARSRSRPVRVVRHGRRRPRASTVQPSSVRWKTATPSSAERSGGAPSRSVGHRRGAGESPRAPRPRRGPVRRRRPGGRRARRSALTTAATARKTTARAGSRRRSIVNVWIGGVKYQLTRRKPDDRGGERGPDAADRRDQRRRASRKSSRTLGSPRSVRRCASTQVSSGRPTAASGKPSEHAPPRQCGRAGACRGGRGVALRRRRG